MTRKEDSSNCAWTAGAQSAEEFRASHDVLIKIAGQALSTCLEKHQPKCPSHHHNPESFLPTRLIDLEVLERPKLIVSAESQVLDRRYIPLSHQWGRPGAVEKEAMTTLRKSLDERTKGFDIGTLPSRYQSAMILCHFMGIRYVWIDSLCIVQV
jgi:hypothetical protein